MNKIPFYIITSDQTSFILPVTAHLLNKYWGSEQQFKILGNNKPSAELPPNFEFIKIKNDNNIQKWSCYIADYLKENESSKHIIVTLDDYFPNQKLNLNTFNDLVDVAKSDDKIGRINIGYFNSNRINQVDIMNKKEQYDLFYLKQSVPYRLTCQTSLWNKSYLIHYFSNNFTPWDLELKGSDMANNDGFHVAGTYKSFAFDWIQESSLSGRHKGKINVLGLPIEDIKYLIEANMLDKNVIQYGMWQDYPVITFNEIGFDFTIEMLKGKVDDYTFSELMDHYGHIYK